MRYDTEFRSKSRPQRGEGRVGFVIALFVFASLLFVGIKVVPVHVTAYQFREALREEARFAAAYKKDARDVARRIMEHAEAMEVPLEPKNLSIRRTRSEVIINASYEQPIDLKVTTYTYRFNAEQRNPTF